jgi:phage tail-like protein
VGWPHLNAHFQLLIDGLNIGDFSECTGLAGDLGTEDYLEGGENRFAHRFPVRASYPNLVLKRGLSDTVALWSWYFEYVESGRVAPRDGQVHLMAWSTVDNTLKPVRVWAFRRGYPVKMTGPDLNAQSPAVAIESVEVVHHGLILVPVPA